MTTSNNSNTSSVVPIASNSKVPESDSSSQTYAVMPSFFYLSLEAMQDGANIWLEQQKSSLEAERALQMTMIGGQENLDGSWKVDVNKGYIASIVQADEAQGEDQAKGLMADMTSHIGAAAANGGMGAVSLGGGAWQSAKISNVNKEITSTEKFSSELDNTAGVGVQMDSSSNAIPEPEDRAVNQKIEAWKNGNELEFNQSDATAKTAMERLKSQADPNPEDLKTVKENIKNRLSSLKSERDRLAQSDNWVRYGQMATGMVTNSIDAAMSVKKADAKEAEAKEVAAAAVFQSVQQTATSQVDKLKEDSAKYQQAAEGLLTTISQLRA